VFSIKKKKFKKEFLKTQLQNKYFLSFNLRAVCLISYYTQIKLGKNRFSSILFKSLFAIRKKIGSHKESELYHLFSRKNIRFRYNI